MQSKHCCEKPLEVCGLHLHRRIIFCAEDLDLGSDDLGNPLRLKIWHRFLWSSVSCYCHQCIRYIRPVLQSSKLRCILEWYSPMCYSPAMKRPSIGRHLPVRFALVPPWVVHPRTKSVVVPGWSDSCYNDVLHAGILAGNTVS